MILVLDTSAVISVVIPGTCTDTSTLFLEEADFVIAPDLFIPEVTNTIWKYSKAGIFTTEQSEKLIDQAIALPDRIIESQQLYREAFAIAVSHKHPVYDTLYLALARRNNATLLTLDQRLAELARKLDIKTAISP